VPRKGRRWGRVEAESGDEIVGTERENWEDSNLAEVGTREETKKGVVPKSERKNGELSVKRQKKMILAYLRAKEDGRGGVMNHK